MFEIQPKILSIKKIKILQEEHKKLKVFIESSKEIIFQELTIIINNNSIKIKKNKFFYNSDFYQYEYILNSNININLYSFELWEKILYFNPYINEINSINFFSEKKTILEIDENKILNIEIINLDKFFTFSFFYSFLHLIENETISLEIPEQYLCFLSLLKEEKDFIIEKKIFYEITLNVKYTNHIILCCEDENKISSHKTINYFEEYEENYLNTCNKIIDIYNEAKYYNHLNEEIIITLFVIPSNLNLYNYINIKEKIYIIYKYEIEIEKNILCKIYGKRLNINLKYKEKYDFSQKFIIPPLNWNDIFFLDKFQKLCYRNYFTRNIYINL